MNFSIFSTLKDNIREYNSIKFFRGKRRNNAELLRLDDAGLDFDYKRLLIEENEVDLHIYFSRMEVYEWLSWGFLALAIICFQFPIITSVILAPAVLSRFFSYRCKKMFQFVFHSYNLALAIVDSVIQQDHGFSL